MAVLTLGQTWGEKHVAYHKSLAGWLAGWLAGRLGGWAAGRLSLAKLHPTLACMLCCCLACCLACCLQVLAFFAASDGIVLENLSARFMRGKLQPWVALGWAWFDLMLGLGLACFHVWELHQAARVSQAAPAFLLRFRLLASMRAQQLAAACRVAAARRVSFRAWHSERPAQ